GLLNGVPGYPKLGAAANAPNIRTQRKRRPLVMSDKFRAARDFLLANRSDYEAAYRGFRWPKLDRFNWALDWFDSIAAGDRHDQPALWVVFEDGTETKLSFRQLSN